MNKPEAPKAQVYLQKSQKLQSVNSCSSSNLLKQCGYKGSRQNFIAMNKQISNSKNNDVKNNQKLLFKQLASKDNESLSSLSEYVVQKSASKRKTVKVVSPKTLYISNEDSVNPYQSPNILQKSKYAAKSNHHRTESVGITEHKSLSMSTANAKLNIRPQVTEEPKNTKKKEHYLNILRTHN